MYYVYDYCIFQNLKVFYNKTTQIIRLNIPAARYTLWRAFLKSTTSIRSPHEWAMLIELLRDIIRAVDARVGAWPIVVVRTAITPPTSNMYQLYM